MNPGEMYDNMDESAKDMPRSEFIKRYNAATDQKTMQRDLSRILIGREQKRVVDRVVRGQN